MKKDSISIYIISFLMIWLFSACENDNERFYAIDLKGTPDLYETLNVNDKLEIPIKISCDAGLKSAFYKIATQEPEKEVKIGAPIPISVLGNELDTVITIPVTQYLHSIVFAVYDNNNQINVRTIRVESVKIIPEISFKDNIKVRNTVCVGIPFGITGSIVSKHELKSVSLIPVVGGKESSPINVNLTDKLSVNFSESVSVEEGLQHVLVKAENIYGGIAVDTFNVLKVVTSDFVEVNLDGGVIELNRIINGESNPVNGKVTSGSDIASVMYALKIKGTVGVATAASLTENSGNEAKFTFNVEGNEGLEAVQVVVANKGGKSVTTTYLIPALQVRAAYLKDVEMSTDPADNKCFIALYEDTKVFGVDVAKKKQDKIDFFLANKSNGVQPLSPHAYGAGEAYYNASKPYLMGFNELTYSFLSSKRGQLKSDEFNNVLTENELVKLLEYRIIGPKPEGEGYNIKTASRRVGDTFNTTDKKEGGFILGWGSHTHPQITPSVVDNVAFAVFWVKSVTQKPNGHYVIVFDVKYPVDNQRIKSNKSSIEPYAPYLL